MALRDKSSPTTKPTLVCVGTIGSFGGLVFPKQREDGTQSKYVYEKIELRPASGSTKAKLNLMWAPEFFDPAVTADDIKANFSSFVFDKNIETRNGSGGFLKGLAGSKDTYEALEEALGGITDFTAENIHEVLDGCFSQQGEPVIYILKQESKKVGEDANGKGIYEAGDYYEVDNVLWLTKSNVEFLAKRVKSNEDYREKQAKAGKTVPAKIVFKFDPVDYGIDVEIPGAEPAWVG